MEGVFSHSHGKHCLPVTGPGEESERESLPGPNPAPVSPAGVADVTPNTGTRPQISLGGDGVTPLRTIQLTPGIEIS